MLKLKVQKSLNDVDHLDMEISNSIKNDTSRVNHMNGTDVENFLYAIDKLIDKSRVLKDDKSIIKSSVRNQIKRHSNSTEPCITEAIVVAVQGILIYNLSINEEEKKTIYDNIKYFCSIYSYIEQKIVALNILYEYICIFKGELDVRTMKYIMSLYIQRKNRFIYKHTNILNEYMLSTFDSCETQIERNKFFKVMLSFYMDTMWSKEITDYRYIFVK